jgi:hypothetical protein
MELMRMFTDKSIRNLVENALSIDSNFVKDKDTYTAYTGQNEKVNVHFLRTEIQVFKGTFLIEKFKITSQKDFKEAEKKAKEIIKRVRFLSK